MNFRVYCYSYNINNNKLFSMDYIIEEVDLNRWLIHEPMKTTGFLVSSWCLKKEDALIDIMNKVNKYEQEKN